MPPIQRNQGTPLSQQGQEDIFSSSRLGSNQGSFRFGGSQGSVGQPSQQPQPSSIDDFPPLNNNNNSGFRNGNGDIGQERGSNLMSTLGFGATTSPAPGMQGSRAGNGLLNALSENSRSGQVRSPDVSNAPGKSRIRSAPLDCVSANLSFPRFWTPSRFSGRYWRGATPKTPGLSRRQFGIPVFDTGSCSSVFRRPEPARCHR